MFQTSAVPGLFVAGQVVPGELGEAVVPPIPPEKEATQFTNLRWVKRRSKVASIDKDRDVAIAVALMLLGD